MADLSDLRANIAFPTRYRFGWGRRAELATEVLAARITRPLVVTDPGVTAQPWAPPLLAELLAAGGAIFSALSSNVTEPEVLAGVHAYRDAGCDGVVAIGGGAPIDAAKAIALIAGHAADDAHAHAPDAPRAAPGVVATFAIGGARAYAIRATAVPPIVAMPTTAGTGSDLSIGAAVTDPAARAKRTLLHPALLPRAVVADPEVTVGLPAAVTAATALDALTHAIEALCAPAYHPMCDAIALEAIRMIHAHLPRAVADGADGEARAHLLMASSIAAVAFHKGLGLTHAMAHPLGATTGVHHGLANAVLLPHVLDVNRTAIGPACRRLLAAIDLTSERGDPVDQAIGAVRELARTCGLPATVPAPAGDPDAAIAELTRLATAERLYLATNPRAVTADEIAAAYRRALGLA